VHNKVRALAGWPGARAALLLKENKGGPFVCLCVFGKGRCLSMRLCMIVSVCKKSVYVFACGCVCQQSID